MPNIKKPTPNFQSLGGPFDDPGLLFVPDGYRESLLFDCGELKQLSVAQLLRVRWLCLSHLHIDHFIGFDQLLRVRLFSPLPLTIFGPTGTAEAVAAKLRGYAWNLTGESPFEVEAFDLDQTGNLQPGLRFRCQHQFTPCSSLLSPSLFGNSSGLDLGGGLRVTSHPVQHGVPCLAYRLHQHKAPRVDTEALEDWKIEPGPWLGRLIKGGQVSLEVNGEVRSREWLTATFLREQPGFSLGYLTDTCLTASLTRSLKTFFRGVDLLCSETAYLNKEAELAERHQHLTAAQVANLADSANCKRLGIFHLSRRYQDQGAQPHLEEARSIFRETHLLCDIGPSTPTASHSVS